ncbi:hypothetical protein DPMN_000090 [Dreissena polymorpha]|uniref:Uncharacterized protein n=1 Tax=Dreissena polymorpha TaxID=45954 RepID=A0A9D4RRD4_DREPO|nr:hypothetical protein DPMN_000090 [Dreissena polymorpha]
MSFVSPNARYFSAHSQNAALLLVKGHIPELLPVPQTTEVFLEHFTVPLRGYFSVCYTVICEKPSLGRDFKG